MEEQGPGRPTHTMEEQGPGFPVLVRLPQKLPKFSLKIKKYFSSKKKSGGEETCEVTEINPCTYQVCFQDQEARDRVLRRTGHLIESIPVQVTIWEDGPHHRHQPPRTPQSADLYKEDMAGNNSRDPGRPVLPEGDDGSSSHPTDHKTDDPGSAASAEVRGPPIPEIFLETSTMLNTDVFPKEILQEITQTFPSLRMMPSESSVEVRGSYKMIGKLYNFLEMKLGGAVPPSVYDEVEEEEDGEECLNLQTALYEYFAAIYQEEVAMIENQFNVKVTEVRRSKNVTYIKLKPLGPNSSVEKAKQIFINKVQAVTKDWSQKEAPISAMKASLEDTKQYMKENHKTLVIVDGGRIILQGPERELTLAVQALQTEERRPPPPRRVITISSRDTKSEVLVDARHMDILKKLKSREMEELQLKYRVRMDEEGKDRNVSVTFTAMSGAPDLGAHACHSFISLLQSTIMNLHRKTINGTLGIGEEALAQFSSRLRKGGVDVILEHEKGSITLIAPPILLDFAEEKLREIFQIQTAASGGYPDEAMDTTDPPDRKTSVEEEEKCPICLDQIKKKKVLKKCKHEFCTDCLQQWKRPVCPVCSVPYGVVIGNQPTGTMTHTSSSLSLPGYPGCGSITIVYDIPGGIQQKDHPNPGKRFQGTQRRAYLPDNTEGRKVLDLLKKAFNQKLIFTVGESRTTSATDCVTWNDIHHKTSTSGGSAMFGYPDPEYLKRVRDELKAKGVE